MESLCLAENLFGESVFWKDSLRNIDISMFHLPMLPVSIRKLITSLYWTIGTAWLRLGPTTSIYLLAVFETHLHFLINVTRIICKSITWFDIGSFAWEKGHQVTYIQWGVGELKWFSVSGDGNCLYLWLNYRILHLNFFFWNFPFATHLIIPISKHLCSSLLSSSRVSLLNVWSISVTILLLKKKHESIYYGLFLWVDQR